DVDVAYQWLYYFFEEDDERMKRIRDEYVSGSLLTGELKEILIEKVQKFLDGFREARQRAVDKVHLYVRDGELASKMWESWPDSE
ncbi:MAG: tryptophan--tRNA ligase, partial [Candidatus Caldarchaeum sp.]|nr:tryptophan--tRNA ligase [Candidatus Caldarchaeum sp.]